MSWQSISTGSSGTIPRTGSRTPWLSLHLESVGPETEGTFLKHCFDPSCPLACSRCQCCVNSLCVTPGLEDPKNRAPLSLQIGRECASGLACSAAGLGEPWRRCMGRVPRPAFQGVSSCEFWLTTIATVLGEGERYSAMWYRLDSQSLNLNYFVRRGREVVMGVARGDLSCSTISYSLPIQDMTNLQYKKYKKQRMSSDEHSETPPYIQVASLSPFYTEILEPPLGKMTDGRHGGSQCSPRRSTVSWCSVIWKVLEPGTEEEICSHHGDLVSFW